MHDYYSGPARYVVTNWLASLMADDYEWAKLFVVESALRAARADELRTLLEAESPGWPPQQYLEREWTGPAAEAWLAPAPPMPPQSPGLATLPPVAGLARVTSALRIMHNTPIPFINPSQ